MEPARLRKIGLFESFSDEELREVSPFAGEISVPEGRTLVREGDYSYEFMGIEEGSAEVTRADEHVTDLGPGDFFGEIGLLERGKRTATVTATSPMRLITLSGWDMRRVEKAMPAAVQRLRQIIEQRRPQAHA